jgi:glycosyltransferase involved in cell wall biosynthesis
MNTKFSVENKKISVIIPAYNESEFIGKIIAKYRSEGYSPLEIIVVDNSTDGGKTCSISKEYADKVLSFPGPIGVSRARNEGAKVATGEIFLFSDADSYISKDGLEKISRNVALNTMGTPLGASDKRSFRGSILFFVKNWAHRLKIYKGVIDGVFFCHKNIFLKTGGFDENQKVAEFRNFIERAEKLGAKYKLLTKCKAFTSLRRYEKKGYLRTFFFWLIWMILFIFKKDEKFRERYFK